MALKGTTLNMRKDVYDQLHYLSDQTSLKMKEIILFSLHKFRQASPKPEIFSKNSEYQDKYLKWKKFHIRFNSVEREISMDMRKIYKLSLSYIVAYSLMMYGDLLLSKIDETTHDYFPDFMYSYTSDEYEYYSVEEFGVKTISIKWSKTDIQQE